MSEPLLVGQAVELDVDGATPPCRVMGVVVGTPAHELLLSLGGDGQAPPALKAGAPATLSFATTMGFHQARTSVLRVSGTKTILLAVERFAEVSTSQRRQFFRVPTSVVTVLVGESARQEERAQTQDLSAGGMRVDTTMPLAIGDRLRVTVETPRELRKHLPAALVCDAQVVRVEQVTRRNRLLCSAGLQFVFASENERDRWVQLTFELQRGVQL